MDLVEFKKRAKNVSGHRKHRVTKSWGVKAGYAYYRKVKPKDKKYILSEGEYYKIIRQCNKAIRDAIIDGNSVILPCRMGTLELLKKPAGSWINNEGKLMNSMPFDWNATLELWYNDAEAYKNKTLVKIPEKEVFSVTYNRRTAFYPNSLFYTFATNREFKLMLKEAIKEGTVDSFVLYN